MKKTTLILLMFLGLFVVASTAQQDVSDEALLQAMDDARFLSTSSFKMTVELIADRPDGTDQGLVQLYFQVIDDENFFRLEFLLPEDQAGEVFVSGPDGTFLWNPDLFEPLQVSAQQQVFGDASVADTVGIRFAEGDYQIASREAVTLEDGTPALEVVLEATGPEVTFPAVTVWVNPDTLRPLQMRVFALGNEPINDVTFEEYGELDGDSYLVRQLIESRFIEGNKTLLIISSIEAGELDADLFDPDKLGN